MLRAYLLMCKPLMGVKKQEILYFNFKNGYDGNGLVKPLTIHSPFVKVGVSPCYILCLTSRYQCGGIHHYCDILIV